MTRPVPWKHWQIEFHEFLEKGQGGRQNVIFLWENLVVKPPPCCLVAVLIGLLLVPGGWWVGLGLQNCSELLDTTPSNLERRWLGAGGGILWLGWWAGVSVSEAPERKPWDNTCVFRFLRGRGRNAPYPSSVWIP